MYTFIFQQKAYPFTHFHIIRHDMQFFVTPFFLKSAKLTKKRLKVIEYAARNYLNIRNTLRFKALTANFSLTNTYSFTKNSKYTTLLNSPDFRCIISII